MALHVAVPDKSVRLEAENAALRREMSDLREIVLSLMPSKLQALLFDGTAEEGDGGGRDWASAVAGEVLKHARPRPAREMNDFGGLSDRALCPLCGRSSINFYGEHGFAYPHGLLSHLLGEGTAHECEIMEAARKLAIERRPRSLFARRA
jgi:hypothetical protein